MMSILVELMASTKVSNLTKDTITARISRQHMTQARQITALMGGKGYRLAVDAALTHYFNRYFARLGKKIRNVA